MNSSTPFIGVTSRGNRRGRRFQGNQGEHLVERRERERIGRPEKRADVLLHAGEDDAIRQPHLLAFRLVSGDQLRHAADGESFSFGMLTC